MKVHVTRSQRMSTLLLYLVGPGRANEHTNPQLIAGEDVVTFEMGTGETLSRDDGLKIAEIMDKTRKQFGTEVTVPVREFDQDQRKYVTTGRKPAHVWHCSLGLEPEKGDLTTEQWVKIAHDFVEAMGFIDPEGVKTSLWAAIHHGRSTRGNDHIHIVVQMVCLDGTKANVHYDIKRAQRVTARIAENLSASSKDRFVLVDEASRPTPQLRGGDPS